MDFSLELSKTVQSIEKIILAHLPESEGFQKTVIEAMDYSVEAGGKRLRPMLMLKSYELFNPDKDRDMFMRPVLHAFMSAMEMIHTFSLCHDDLPCMDGDKYRRGRESTWYKYGEDMGTLAGDGLFIYAFETVSEVYEKQLSRMTAGEVKMSPDKIALYASEVLRAVNILSGKSGIYGMLGGQAVDVEMTGKPLSDEQLMFIYRLKTGALLAASLMIGAVLAGASKEDIVKISETGDEIGIAFQIQDDILDETSTEEVLGKPIHSDEENNKTTFVSLYGLQHSHDEVERLSELAIAHLKEFENVDEDSRDFLLALTTMLISRKK